MINGGLWSVDDEENRRSDHDSSITNRGGQLCLAPSKFRWLICTLQRQSKNDVSEERKNEKNSGFEFSMEEGLAYLCLDIASLKK